MCILSVIEKCSTFTSVLSKEANTPVGICFSSKEHSKSIGLNVVVQFRNQEKGVKWVLVGVMKWDLRMYLLHIGVEFMYMRVV